MAVKDVKDYYYKIQAQYIEMKEDLADFEKALKNGYITEDQVEAVKDDVAKLEQNYQRITYILYLLDLPKRKSKREKFNHYNKKLLNSFEENKSSLESVSEENKNLLNNISDNLNKLIK